MNRLSWGFLGQARVQGLHDIIAREFDRGPAAVLISASEHAAFFAISLKEIPPQITVWGSMAVDDKDGV